MKKHFFPSCIILLSALAMQATATKTPDFRYPENVIKEATTQITEALKRGDGSNAVDGLVKLSLAKSKISADFMPEMICKIDSTANILADKPTKALLYSLEADIYYAAYSRNRYKYDSRTEIADEVPTDMGAWTGKNFRDTIIALYSKSLSYKEALQAAKTENYSKLLADTKIGKEFAPTLYEVIAYNAISNVEKMSTITPMPLRSICNLGTFINLQIKSDDKSRDFIETTYQSLLSANDNYPAVTIYTDIQRLNYMADHTDADYETRQEKLADLLLDLYNRFSNDQYSTEALLELTGSIYKPYSRKVYKLAKRNIERFPDYERIAGLQNYVQKYEQKNAVLRYDETLVAGDSIAIGITARNTKRVTVKAYKIPESLELKGNLMKLLPKFSLVKSMSYDITTQEENAVNFAPLGVGKYLIIPEFTDKNGKKVVSNNEYDGDIARVTNLSVQPMTVAGENRIYVLDTRNGKPLANAIIHIEGNSKSKIPTNKLGYVVIKDSGTSTYVYATYSNDRSDRIYVYRDYNSSQDRSYKQGEVYTDLAVYRPGDTVKFAAVVYDSYKNDNNASKNTSVNISISDPNGKEVSTMQLVTDFYGRIDSSFVAPKSGLTGEYFIRISDASTNERIAYHNVTVSEYKAPTFYINYDKEKSNLAGIDNLYLKGRVMTYSQFPMAGAKVSYKITPARSWFWVPENSNNESDNGTVTTDSDGNWTINISEEIFGSEKSGYFSVELSATSESGETQTFHTNIGIGNKKYIHVENENVKIESGKSNKIAFRVTDVTGKDIDFDCNYSLISKSDTIAAGSINSGNPVMDMSNLASGSYKLVLSIPGEKKSEKEINLQLYRKTDNVPPCDTPLWVAENTAKCDATGNYSFRFGNSTPAYIYAIVYNADGVVSEEYKFFDKGMHSITGTAKFAKHGETYMSLSTVKNHTSYIEKIQLVSPVAKDSLKIVTETFRDNITPGSHEVWKLRLTGNNVKHYTGAVIANMYDAALNSISPNTWNFYISNRVSYPYSFRDVSTYRIGTSAYSDLKLLNQPLIAIPYINMYGQSFYGVLMGTRRLYAAQNTVSAFGDVVELKSKNEVAKGNDKVFITGAVLDESTVESSSENQESSLRDPDVKTAFFMPALVSDGNGVVTIEFEVPNRNTQWAFTALAYTADMKTDIINKLVTSNKPLMVQPNLPRFVRIGDKVELKTMVMNNSDKATSATVTTELFDPATSKIISTTTTTVALAANGSEVVATEFEAPADLQFIGYRIVAKTDEYSDGEQSVMAILPATTNVVEADPFYFNEKQQKAEIKLPKFNKGGKVTLEYCDNPVWYCATALPSIMSESQTATAFIGNYYASTVANRIVTDVPSVAEAIKYWNERNSLKSNLQKNEELKTIDLANTPWVKAADSETAMMSKLVDLTDPATVQYRKQKALTSLSELQNADGGFSWFRGDYRSSEYLTWNILSRFGYLKEAGYFDTDDALAKSIVAKAIDYSDKTMISEIEKAKKQESQYPRYFYYIFIRSMHKDAAPDNSKVDEIAKAAIADAKKNWGNYPISEKAKAAIMLANYGETKEAAAIVESLRQYARKSTERGYYWDVDDADKVTLAATALKAFHKVNPKDNDIDNIRRWILLNKETMNWGTSPAACDAINAVLATGTSWNNSNRKAPEIKIGDTKIESTADDMYFGYIKRTIDIETAKSGKLSISRHGENPAWGAVYYQYNAPMKDVNKKSSSDVKLEKKFYRYNNDGILENVASTQFKVGDRIQVRLTVRTERDMDYVAITDERPALFEPVDQLPAYEWKEGTFYMRETRDSSTNIFFTRLSKGTRVITYDVFVNNAGNFSSGIATLQCQYAPQITAHSAGQEISAE